MKKKYGLLKVLAGLLALIVILSYFLEDRAGAVSRLALGDVLLNYLQSYYYFFDTTLFVLVVGGFYGVLNKISAYKKMLKSIANKMEDKSKVFVVVLTVVLALISAFTGLNQLLLLVVPMLVSIVLLLGYDKLVALSATIGSIAVGLIGGVFLTIKDPASYSAVAYITIDELVGLEGLWDNIVPKCLLLVLGIGLLVWHILSHIKKSETGSNSYQLSKNDPLYVEVKDKTGKVVKTDTNNTRVWPLVIAMVLLFVLLVLGYLPWNDLFGLEIFNDFHNWILGLKVGDFAVFTNVISSSLSTYGAFGAWAGLGGYMVAMVVVIMFAVILVIGYGIKFEEAIDGFLYGVKKMLPAVIVVGLAYTVLVCGYNNGFIETLITKASEQFGDNALIHSLVVLVGSVLNVDLYYTTAGIFTTVTSSLTDSANLSVYATMFQSLYGLVQVVGPTSIMLLVGLSYLEVPYKTWLKYIWRFIVELLIVILVVLMIVSLL